MWPLTWRGSSSLPVPKTSLLIQLVPSLGTAESQLFGVQDETSTSPHHKLQRRRQYPCTRSLAQKLTKQRALTKEVASMTPCSSSGLSWINPARCVDKFTARWGPTQGHVSLARSQPATTSSQALETPDGSHIGGSETTSPQIPTTRTSLGLLKSTLEHWVHWAGPQSPTLWICHLPLQRVAECFRG